MGPTVLPNNAPGSVTKCQYFAQQQRTWCTPKPVRFGSSRCEPRPPWDREPLKSRNGRWPQVTEPRNPRPLAPHRHLVRNEPDDLMILGKCRNADGSATAPQGLPPLHRGTRGLRNHRLSRTVQATSTQADPDMMPTRRPPCADQLDCYRGPVLGRAMWQTSSGTAEP